jgi:DNA-binding transcriptional MerR regulator
VRIGELARRTGASVRSLRYYESRSLLTSHRMANGYRDFDDDQVTRVRTICQLLDAGLTLDTIAVVAPCYTEGTIRPHCDAARARARRELANLDHRAAVIDAARTALRQLLHPSRSAGTSTEVAPRAAPTASRSTTPGAASCRSARCSASG